MSGLRQSLEEYLTVRRALGFELRLPGAALAQFVDFAEREGASFITIDLALRWAQQPAGVQPARWATRLSMVRHFARYCCAADPRTEVPPDGLLPHRYRRKPPYLYNETEIDRLIAAARQLPSPTGLRAVTYSTLFGLLAVTGMRLSESFGLDREDVDLSRGLLTLRHTKFGKSRWVPVHRSTQHVLQKYQRRRDRLYPHPKDPSFFLAERGTRLTDSAVRATFIKLSHQIGLRKLSDRRGPRLHDLRHAFAVRTLLGWYRAGLDVERELPKLSTYLGHAHVRHTYWYLSAVPELLQCAAARLQADPEGALP